MGFVYQPLLTLMLFQIFTCKQSFHFNVLSKQDISKIVRRSHLLLGLNYDTINMLNILSSIYQSDDIEFALYLGDIKWDGISLDYNGKPDKKFALFVKVKEDRKCLLKSSIERNLKPISIDENESLGEFVDVINKNCFLFRDENGTMNEVGTKRKHLLENFYHVVTDRKYPSCETIKTTTPKKFIEKYLFRSKPVIIKNAVNHWTAMKKWTNDFLRSKYADNQVHVKITENGEFEGCDKANKFENFDSFKIPKEVMQHLRFQDLVVVRPAVADIKFSTFLDIIENANNTYKNVSAYLEYSSIKEYFPELRQDISDILFVKNKLHLSHLNMWLSNGHTVGKLHFDPFDNFLCQLRGQKRVTLFEPHNNVNLYEGHIQEAILKYDFESKRVTYDNLLDSTSMVMSPIDINNVDFERFSNFSNAKPIECILNEGDVLYMPSFWWHEVRSFPNYNEKRNLAVNFWYKPFFEKEFPCAECKLDVNPLYLSLLEEF